MREQQLPFKVSRKSPEPSERLKEALEELEYVEKHPNEYKSYHNINTFIEDILK